MTLTVHDVEQRSPEWLQLRAGIVTASVVGQLLTTEQPDALEFACPSCKSIKGISCASLASKLRTPIKTVHPERSALASKADSVLKVADNDTSRALTLSLVAERITGHTEEGGYVSNDMLRGVYEEPRARDLYAETTGQEVTECGFMIHEHDGLTLGYSPDGLVGDRGLLEVKCPRPKGHLATILTDEPPARHMAQMQAGMLVSGRDWCDYVSFCGGLPLFVKRVPYDAEYMDAIWEAVAAFEKNAAAMTADYHARTDGLPVPERIDYFEEIVI